MQDEIIIDIENPKKDDFISRQAAIDAVRGSIWAQNHIKNLPSVTPQKVVRCKDCKHLYQDGECLLRLWKTHVEDDFCSYGERR